MKNSKRFIALFASLTLLFLSSVMSKRTYANSINAQVLPAIEDSFISRHDELTALLNWAAYLTGYQVSESKPKLEFRPHQFFVDNACYGNQKCKVVGWYNDEGVVYIDDKLNALNSRFERSLVVHEFVHYLQHISGKFETGTCEDFVSREREAYATQREFIMAYGAMPSMSFHQHSCARDLARDTQLVSQ